MRATADFPKSSLFCANAGDAHNNDIAVITEIQVLFIYFTISGDTLARAATRGRRFPGGAPRAATLHVFSVLVVCVTAWLVKLNYSLFTILILVPGVA